MQAEFNIAHCSLLPNNSKKTLCFQLNMLESQGVLSMFNFNHVKKMFHGFTKGTGVILSLISTVIKAIILSFDA